MPIPLPDLDDRTYADLASEARALIPRYAPTWTDHNASDPGITLVELLAFLTEATLYRINRIPPASELRFLALLGKELQPGQKPDVAWLRRARTEVINLLRQPQRAITAGDFERLVLESQTGTDRRIVRVKCLPGIVLDTAGASRESEGDVSVIVVPAVPDDADMPVPSDNQIRSISDYLDALRPINTRVYVRGPIYTTVMIEVDLVHDSRERPGDVERQVRRDLNAFFHPLRGGGGGGGWPFGRSVYASEVCQVIEASRGVDHVETLCLKSPTGAQPAADLCLDVVPVPAGGLVRFDASTSKFRVR